MRRSGWSARTPIRPCLRVKPNPDTGTAGWRQLGVEVYGGVLAQLVARPRPRHRRPRRAARRVGTPGRRAPSASRGCRNWRSTSTASVNDDGLEARPATAPPRRSGAPGPRPPATSPSGSRTPPASTARRGGSCACTTCTARGACSAATRRCSPAAGSTTRCRAGRPRRPSPPVRSRRRGVDGRPLRPRGGRVGEHHRRAAGRSSSTCSSGSSLATRRRRATTSAGPLRGRRACRPTTPTPCTRTTPSATSPSTGPLVNAGPAIKVNANQRYATVGAARRPCSSALRGRRRVRGRSSCRATTCRAARRSGRSPRPGSGSRPSTSACRNCRCTPPASCAASTIRRGWLRRSPPTSTRRPRPDLRPVAGPRRRGAAARRGARRSAP